MGFANIYMVELLAKQRIQVNPDRLLAALKNSCGAVDVVMNDAQKGSFAFAFLDYKAEFKDGAIPVQMMLNTVKHDVMKAELEASLQQTWDWAEAKTVVPHCKDGLLIMDFMAGTLAYKRRTDLWDKVLRALVSTVECEAIHWKPSQKFIKSSDFLAAKNPLAAALNVRLFNIQNTSPQEFVMDTIGLAAIGLPDVQIHFRQFDPNQIANFLFNLGTYLFEKGDIIGDGETVESFPAGEKWHCQHEMALVAPEREVLDVNPGAPYAAGKRE